MGYRKERDIRKDEDGRTSSLLAFQEGVVESCRRSGEFVPSDRSEVKGVGVGLCFVDTEATGVKLSDNFYYAHVTGVDVADVPMDDPDCVNDFFEFADRFIRRRVRRRGAIHWRHRKELRGNKRKQQERVDKGIGKAGSEEQNHENTCLIQYKASP